MSGVAEYSSAALAEAAVNNEVLNIYNRNLPFAEVKDIGSLILHTKTGLGNTVNARYVAIPSKPVGDNYYMDYRRSTVIGTGGGGGSGATTFLALSDTPISYAGQANKILGVSSGETGVEFKSATATSAGTINIPTGQQYQINGGSIVVDAINDAVTTTSPSQNAVFDALALKENISNKENVTVDTSTTKYPTVNLLKTYADTKDPSITNELNTTLSFNTLTRQLNLADAGGNLTATIPTENVVNGYAGTIPITTGNIVVNYPTVMSNPNYPYRIRTWYPENVNGRNIQMENTVYNFSKTVNGFSLSVDTIAGYLEYEVRDSVNLLIALPANFVVQNDSTVLYVTPTQLASKNYIRNNQETDQVYTASSWYVTTNNSTNWNTSYTDRLKWDGGATGLTATTGRASLGATTIGSNMFTFINPSATTFPRFNADNSITALSAIDFRTAIGAGTSTALNLDLTTSLSVNQSYQGIVENGTVGENVVFGDVLYLKFSDGKWWKAAASTYATTPAVRMALAAISANASGLLLIQGNVRYDSWAFGANKIYLSDSVSGGITSTQPVTTGSQIQVVGTAKTSTTMYFKPSNDVGEK